MTIDSSAGVHPAREALGHADRKGGVALLLVDSTIRCIWNRDDSLLEVGLRTAWQGEETEITPVLNGTDDTSRTVPPRFGHMAEEG